MVSRRTIVVKLSGCVFRRHTSLLKASRSWAMLGSRASSGGEIHYPELLENYCPPTYD